MNLETRHLAPRTCEPVHPKSSPVLHGTVQPGFATVTPEIGRLIEWRVAPMYTYIGKDDLGLIEQYPINGDPFLLENQLP